LDRCFVAILPDRWVATQARVAAAHWFELKFARLMFQHLQFKSSIQISKPTNPGPRYVQRFADAAASYVPWPNATLMLQKNALTQFGENSPHQPDYLTTSR